MLGYAALSLVLHAAPGVAHAQEDTVPCPQGRVTRILVENHAVFDLSDSRLDPRLGRAYRLANRVHIETDEEVIRREILIREGDCHDPERLLDSERMLRALGFIAEASVTSVAQPDGTVQVFVVTRDEWSLRVEPRVSSTGRTRLVGFRVREDNLVGRGVHLSGFYFDRAEERVFGATLFDPQLLDTRWDGLMEVGRTPVGFLVSQSLAYPFVGEAGRWAFRQGVYHNHRYFEYRAPRGEDMTSVWLPESRMSAEIGGLYRWGPERNRRVLAGAALRGEWLSYSAEAAYADPRVRVGRPPPWLGPPLDTLRSVRAVFLVGQRNVSFQRRRGLETVRGTEDVRLGIESHLAFAPSLPIHTEEPDIRVGLDVSAAREFDALGMLGANLLFEGRRGSPGADVDVQWNDLFGHFRTWGYWRRDPEGVDLLVTSIAFSGGWNVRVPFQLTLGSDVGLRGYPHVVDAGARRVVASAEYRRFLGWPLPHLFDLGSVAFLDAGKMWAGDAPFGVTSPVRVGAGVGLRAAFPSGSRRSLRLDVGVPLASGIAARDVTFTIGMGQWIGRGPRLNDPQMRRSVHLWTRQSLLALPSD